MVIFKHCRKPTPLLLFNECIYDVSGTVTAGFWWSQMDIKEGSGDFGRGWVKHLATHFSELGFRFLGNVTVSGSDDILSGSVMMSKRSSENHYTHHSLFSRRAGCFVILDQGGFALGKAVLSLSYHFLAIHVFGNGLQKNVLRDFFRDWGEAYWPHSSHSKFVLDDWVITRLTSTFWSQEFFKHNQPNHISLHWTSKRIEVFKVHRRVAYLIHLTLLLN